MTKPAGCFIQLIGSILLLWGLVGVYRDGIGWIRTLTGGALLILGGIGVRKRIKRG